MRPAFPFVVPVGTVFAMKLWTRPELLASLAIGNSMDLVSFAYRSGFSTLKVLARDERKQLGQFLTPPQIARTMARRMCAGLEKSVVSVMDPSAGSGVLTAAIVESLLSLDPKPSRIDISMHEIDPRLARVLKRLADRIRRVGSTIGVRIRVHIYIDDFLMSETAHEKTKFDIVIANPPYFKLGKRDPRSQRHAYAVHGQPNIYGLFMAACARLMVPGGRWCFITPRSWTNGTYFASVRREILQWLKIDAMHIFESRREHFSEGEILQEAMITWASARAEAIDSILVSTSEGALDLSAATLRAVPIHDIIGKGTRRVISLPDPNRNSPLRQFAARLSTFGIRVSTGPVVAFRASEFLSEERRKDTVPLLWMQHVDQMRISWPISKKREHIQATADTAWMLVPNANMVIMRRFSPKEAARRVIAAPYIANTIPGATIGLENHTNYLYRPGGEMADDEARGLAAYLNCNIVDQFFREVSGNTQVNAEDIRSLPLPARDVLIWIGSSLSNSCALKEVDRVVDSILQAAPAINAA